MNTTQRTIVTALVVILFGVGAFAWPDNQKLNVLCFSNEYKVIKYLMKMEMNIGNPVWDNSPQVIKMRAEDGSVILSEARQHFINRGIMSGAEFDAATQRARDLGLVNTTVFRAIQSKQSEWSQVEDACKAYAESLVPKDTGTATST